MADTLDCPEGTNSTDCLLRLLLQRIDDRFEEYDWDPITFAFTAPTGLIAALFAAFTIYQTIIAAGRGSRKCNRRAIGKWSRNTTKRWDWHELCQISTARTPILTISEFGLSRRRKGTSDDRHEFREAPSDDPSVASWLRFLYEAGLDYSDLQRMPHKSATADYLPGDLVAAPAYGEIGFLVAASPAAGAYSWELDALSGYPTIISHTSQFEFRQHPALGTVGAFAKYHNNSNVNYTPTFSQAVETVRQSEGRLRVNSFWWQHHVVPLGAMELNVREDLSDLFRIFSLYRVHNLFGRCICWKRDMPVERTDKHHLTWLLLSETPLRPPAIFPSKAIQSKDVFKTLALHSRFWASFMTGRRLPSKTDLSDRPVLIPGYEEWHTQGLPETQQGPELASILNFLNAQTTKEVKGNSGPDLPHLHFGLEQAVFRSPRTVYILGDVFTASVEFMCRPDRFNVWFGALPQLSQSYLRVLILLQIMQLDKWLDNLRGRSLVCRIKSLRMTTLAFLNVKLALCDGSFVPLAGNDVESPFWEQGQQSSCRGDDILAPYFETFRILSQLLDDFKEEIPRHSAANKVTYDSYKDKAEGEMTRAEWQHSAWLKEKLARHTITLSLISGHDPDEDDLYYNFSDIRTILLGLSAILENAREALVSNRGPAGDKQQRKRKRRSFAETSRPFPALDSVTDGSGVEEEAREKGRGGREINEETIHDVLIWKYVLLGMLYLTAPDNSDLLSSALWKRVVPII